MILKFVNGANNDPKDLRRIIEYVRDPLKTEASLTGGYCCDTKYPFEDMMVTKRLYNKTDGKQYEHYIAAFDPDDNVDSELAISAAAHIAKIYNKHQSFFAVHTNTEHLHAHIIMNSVGCDGKKFRQWRTQLTDFKSAINNTVCSHFGLTPIRYFKGCKPADNETMWEFLPNEISEMFGGNNMKFSNGNGYLDNPFYIDKLDLDNDTQDVDITTSFKKALYLGDQFNITCNSGQEALDFITECKRRFSASAIGIKRVMDYYGNGIEYHVGNTYNIDLRSKGDEEDEYADEYIDADYYEYDE